MLLDFLFVSIFIDTAVSANCVPNAFWQFFVISWVTKCQFTACKREILS